MDLPLQGVQIGDDNVQVNLFLRGPAARSAYVSQVRRIALEVPADSTLGARFLDLMAAAATCREASERLVLIVDGLDEDRGVTGDEDSYSIAALLPAVPPAGMWIVVAGRPYLPPPADVADSHPLRDAAIVHTGIWTAEPCVRWTW